MMVFSVTRLLNVSFQPQEPVAGPALMLGDKVIRGHFYVEERDKHKFVRKLILKYCCMLYYYVNRGFIFFRYSVTTSKETIQVIHKASKCHFYG